MPVTLTPAVLSKIKDLREDCRQIDDPVRVYVLVWPPERKPSLRRLRFIFAVLIALSLTVTPMASAWAAAAMPAHHAAAVVPADEMTADMSDCAKMMAPAKTKDCACCDAPAKAPCPDGAACLMKCGAHVLGVLIPPGEFAFRYGIAHERQGDPDKPPDWSLRPPAPPPRV